MSQPTDPLEKLEPCPFCGSPAELVERHNPLSKWRHSVDCRSTTCGASGPVEAGRAKAAGAWNRRDSAFQALRSERDEARKSMAWVDQVYPYTQDGGAWVSMTWREFNEMRAVCGLKPLRVNGEHAGRARADINIKLRLKLEAAEARAQSAEAERAEAGASNLKLLNVIAAKEAVIAAQGDELAEAEAERDALRLRVEEAVKVIEPFAAISPSSLYSEDGSEAERYCVRLYDSTRHEPPHDFTGADLAAARAFLLPNRRELKEEDLDVSQGSQARSENSLASGSVETSTPLSAGGRG